MEEPIEPCTRVDCQARTGGDQGGRQLEQTWDKQPRLQSESCSHKSSGHKTVLSVLLFCLSWLTLETSCGAARLRTVWQGEAGSGISEKSRLGFVFEVQICFCCRRVGNMRGDVGARPADSLAASLEKYTRRFILPSSESLVSLVSLMSSLGSALPRFLSAMASVLSSNVVSS